MEGFQKVWEELRKKGKHLTKYPYDSVVSFVFRYYPKNKPRNEINVLDIGCGIGNHLWFLAREGFNAFGIDGSETAVRIAKELLEEFKVTADVRVYDFTKPLPYEDNFFDLVIDRCSLSCVDYETVKKTIDEIYRILKLGGYFFFTPYSKSHTSYLESSKDGNFVEVKSGSLKGTGFVCFYDEDDIRNLFPDERWKLIELSESVSRDRLSGNINGGWKVVVEKR
jgi:SAM-dependent methyltransferase